MKNLLIIIASALILIFSIGSYDNIELNQYAYVISIGIDKSTDNPNNVAVTFEFVVPIQINSDSSGNSPNTTQITTIEAPTIHSAISLANTYISKELNLSHNKVIVFSEEMAFEGLDKYLDAISNDKNFRANMYMIISKCSAKDYIENTNPSLEKNPAKFYELLLSAYKYTGFASKSLFLYFILGARSYYSQPVVALGNISTEKGNEVINNSIDMSNSYNISKPNDANFYAGEMKKEGGSETEIMGLAVFNGSKLVGELTGEETIYYLLTTNSFKSSYYTIYDPFDISNIISFNLIKVNKTKIDVDFVNGTPLITIDCPLSAVLHSVNPNIDYSNEKNIAKLEYSLENVIKNGMLNYLYKTTQDFGSDISGFGRNAAKNYLTWDKWEKSNWEYLYKHSYFKVNVNVDIKRSGIVFIE